MNPRRRSTDPNSLIHPTGSQAPRRNKVEAHFLDRTARVERSGLSGIELHDHLLVDRQRYFFFGRYALDRALECRAIQRQPCRHAASIDRLKGSLNGRDLATALA